MPLKSSFGKTAGLAGKGAGWMASLVIAGAIGSYIQSLADHKKLLEAQTETQKAAEINAFLKVSQEMYPLVSDEVTALKAKSARKSDASKALVKNLEVQSTTLSDAASYLPDSSKSVAVAYQGNLLSMLSEARQINEPTQAKAFVAALHDAVINGCKVTLGLRQSAGLPKQLDPACTEDDQQLPINKDT